MTSTPRIEPTLNLHRAGTGEPLVLLHGLGESHVGWRPVIDLLATSYDVFALDLPGFGGSPALNPATTPNAANLAAAVENTLDDLGVSDYHVAGYSLGARIAIELAKSARVRTVIAIAPDGLGTPLERIQGYLTLVAGRNIAQALAPIADLLSRTPVGRSVFFAGSRTLPWQLTKKDARQLLTGYADSPAYNTTNWASLFDMPTHLPTITQPTLLLQGTADPLMGQQISRYHASIANAELRWLPGLNHVPISDDPQAVATHITRFLTKHRAPNDTPAAA